VVLDQSRGQLVWRQNDEDPCYNWRLLQNLLQDLSIAQQIPQPEARDAAVIAVVARALASSNLGGMLSTEMHRVCYSGTKELVDRLSVQIAAAISQVVESDSVPLAAKTALLAGAVAGFGRTALCLSGGAGMGQYQLGVCRALSKEGLLPRIISGSSAGAMVAAHVCVRTDEELQQTLNAALAHKMGWDCEFSITTKLKNLLRTGYALGDVSKTIWLELLRWHCKGDTTFEEAYKMTGRVLCITASPERMGHSTIESEPIVLNYLTTPKVTLWSAVMASAAVPPIILPQPLVRKLDDGTLETVGDGKTLWKDGSIEGDIPKAYLSKSLNVGYFIVSQVNPHIVPFHFASKGDVGMSTKGWRGRWWLADGRTGGWRGGYLLAAVECFLKETLLRNLRVMSSLKMLPLVFGCDWHHLWTQEFQGDCTLTPPVVLRDYLKLISRPTETDMDRYLRGGELMTYRKMSMIQTRMRIAIALQKLEDLCTPDTS